MKKLIADLRLREIVELVIIWLVFAGIVEFEYHVLPRNGLLELSGLSFAIALCVWGIFFAFLDLWKRFYRARELRNQIQKRLAENPKKVKLEIKSPDGTVLARDIDLDKIEDIARLVREAKKNAP
jgi:hypothetical protein